jgi:predicted transcriptional regulator
MKRIEKKKTAKMSELRDYLSGMIDEVGDVDVFTINSTDEIKTGQDVFLEGLSKSGALMVSSSNDDKFFVIFKSDEIARF